MSWSEIVPRAVAQNSFRGFHRINTAFPGAKEPFVRYFLEQRVPLMDALTRARTRDEMHDLSNRICRRIREKLTNCLPSQLRPYNKIRKLVDLYIEHLVAMAGEFEKQRRTLVPLLFLPLDKWIMAHPGLFSDRELSLHGLRRRSTYSAITSEQSYGALQKLVLEKAGAVAAEHDRPFYPIYFDLLWQNRYRRKGGNLFETNP